mmetsp:Transcript_3629/g.4441  ORF Transcript_3629/g.4441 Transcript_3629/m.4441 type:complete len:403 (-) Transcript_3629:49-1257(-)
MVRTAIPELTGMGMSPGRRRWLPWVTYSWAVRCCTIKRYQKSVRRPNIEFKYLRRDVGRTSAKMSSGSLKSGQVARPLHRLRARKTVQAQTALARSPFPKSLPPTSKHSIPDVQGVLKDFSGGMEPTGSCTVALIGTPIVPLPEFKYVSACVMRTIPQGMQAILDVERRGSPYSSTGQLLAFSEGEASSVFPRMPKLLVEPYTERVVRGGLQIQLEVFCVDESTGWGVRTREAVGPGFFVCEYAGEVLLEAEAEARCLAAGPGHDSSDAYLFNLTVPSDWRALGSKPMGFGDDCGAEQPEGQPAFVIDAYQHGNIARFINHACGPSTVANISPVFAFTEERPGMLLDARLPRVAFFTNRHISAGEELRYDYSMQPGAVDDTGGVSRSLPCLCRSENCRGRVY